MSEHHQRPAVVRMRGVHKYHYTDEVETAAVHGVGLDIHSAEFVAIMGPSGSGKSTLLNLMGMIDSPSKGQYWFNGHDTSRLSAREKANLRKGNMGFIFQSFNLIDELTAFENIELPLIYLKVPSKERRERTERALASLDMMHRRGHFPQQLSGGQQQRVAIARAIVTEPAIILADEPTGNLDSENSRAVMDKLAHFHQQGATIVMVTHSKEDASYAQRTIELFDGKTLISEEEYLQNNKS